MAKLVLRMRREGQLLGSWTLGESPLEFAIFDPATGRQVGSFEARSEQGPLDEAPVPRLRRLTGDDFTMPLPEVTGPSGRHSLNVQQLRGAVPNLAELPTMRRAALDRLPMDDLTMPWPEVTMSGGGLTDALEPDDGLTGALEDDDGLTGFLEPDDGLTGFLEPDDGLTGALEEDDGLTGALEDDDGLTGALEDDDGLTGALQPIRAHQDEVTGTLDEGPESVTDVDAVGIRPHSEPTVDLLPTGPRQTAPITDDSGLDEETIRTRAIRPPQRSSLTGDSETEEQQAPPALGLRTATRQLRDQAAHYAAAGPTPRARNQDQTPRPLPNVGPSEVWVRKRGEWHSAGRLHPRQRVTLLEGWVKLDPSGRLVVHSGPRMSGSATLLDGRNVEIERGSEGVSLPAGASVVLRGGRHGLYVRSEAVPDPDEIVSFRQGRRAPAIKR